MLRRLLSTMLVLTLSCGSTPSRTDVPARVDPRPGGPLASDSGRVEEERTARLLYAGKGPRRQLRYHFQAATSQTFEVDVSGHHRKVTAVQIDEFIQCVAGEPERILTRTVWITPPEVLAQAAREGGIGVADLLSTSGRRKEQREIRYRHILGAPASQRSFDTWQARSGSHELPTDLRALVSRINGIHLWANVETGRSYSGLAPIEEWEPARTKMYGVGSDPGLLDDRYLALSYHQDGAAFVVFDVETGRYFLMDANGPDETTPIAGNAGELLEWLWRSRIAPK